MSKLPMALLVAALGLLALSFVIRAPGGAAVVVLPDATAAPPTPTPAEQGRALFQAKGCTTCHRHDGLAIERVALGEPSDSNLVEVIGAPDLTHYWPDPAFVRRWLRDPRAVRPETGMPNLRLSEDEIEALLAFLLTNDAEKN